MKRDPSATFTLNAGIGTISAGQNSATVSHPLGSVPSAVQVSPSDGCEAPIEVPVSGITGSEFVVRFVGGITLDADAKFMWVVLS